MFEEIIVDFYDQLAPDYHLITSNWDESVQWQGQTLKQIIESHLRLPKEPTLLDCTCGIGTQIIGLALTDSFKILLGSDISSNAVNRAKQEAQRLNVALDFKVADLRQLSQHFEPDFDLIISCDNAIPHFLTEEDLSLVLREMYITLKPQGSILISLRNYDELLLEKPISTLPRVFNDENGKRIVFQVWNWRTGKPIYDYRLYIIQEHHEQHSVKFFDATYRAWQQNELFQLLIQAGFVDIQWLSPEQSHYYQPILTALKK